MVRVHVHLVAQPGLVDGAAGVGWIDEILARVDGYAIERISTGDVVGNHLELFSALGYMAARTSRVHVGPYVTNGATRDVGYLASLGLSLDAMTRGRAFLILGRGDGVARDLDLRAETVEQTRETIVALRRLLREPTASYRGRSIRLPWPARPGARVPVYAAPGGPRMLRMSAEACDGVYLATGCAEADVRRALDAIAAVPRDEPLDVWWVNRFGVGETRERAYGIVREGLASVGNHSLRGDYAAKGVPEELRDALREYHARFDYDAKNPPLVDGRAAPAAGRTNADLMEELGLADYFLDRFGIVGTPEQVVQRLVELEARGVDAVTLLAQSVDELDLIGTRVLPRLAERGAPA
ncbi:MAG TPA: LLM class flavin-dependent oxidoreductase [Solirubrobacteraceae bacterium]|nr:LLM class flavin-dependent oxidoreductase [Solirubrobacteraceae bacterium]